MGYLSNSPTKMFYMSCPNDKCKKKVTENSEGGYDCSKCQNSIPRPKAMMIGSFQFQDHTGGLFVFVAGNDYCKEIFKMDEEQLYKMKVDNT